MKPLVSFLLKLSPLVICFILVLLLIVFQIPSVQAAVYSGSPGFRVIVTGTNFTPQYNAIQFHSTTTGQTLETLDIGTNDSKTLTFVVPISAIPASDYTIKAGAFNSDWSNSLPFRVTAIKAPILTMTSSPQRPGLNASTTLTWAAEGVSGCIGTSDLAQTPYNFASSTEYDQIFSTGSDSFTYKADKDYYFTLSCKGPGGNITKNLQVTVDYLNKPEITLTATPTSVNVNESSVIAWRIPQASSCQGTSSGGNAAIQSAWNKSQPLSGSLTIYPTANTTLTLSCMNPGGISTKSVNIGFNSQALSAVCTTVPNKQTFSNKELATYSVQVSGGIGGYSYSWSGLDSPAGNTPQVSRYYQSSITGANVAVSSGGATVTAQCPQIFINANALPNGGVPVLNSISPTTAPSGGTITLNGSPFSASNFNENTAVVIKNGGQIIYAKPAIVTANQMTFTFIPALPLPALTPGTVYDISLQNYYGGGTYRQSAVRQLTLSGSITPTTTPPVSTSTLPAVTLTANPTTVETGGSSTLTWSSTNAISCRASGSWTGNQPVNGTLSVTPVTLPYTPVTTMVYSLLCVNNLGKSTQVSASIRVNSSGKNPTVTAVNPTSGISPTLGGAGTNLYVSGSNFNLSPTNSVEFAGPATTTVQNVSSTDGRTIYVQIPGKIPAGKYVISVLNSNGKSSGGPNDRFTANKVTVTQNSTPTIRVFSASEEREFRVGSTPTFSWLGTNIPRGSPIEVILKKGGTAIKIVQTTHTNSANVSVYPENVGSVKFTLPNSLVGGSDYLITVNYRPNGQLISDDGDPFTIRPATALIMLVATSTPVAPKTADTNSPPAITSFVASPYSITLGQSAKLSWTSTNVLFCSGSSKDGAGTVSTVDWAKGLANGDATVSPLANTIYELTCTGTNGQKITATPVKIAVRQPTSFLGSFVAAIGDAIGVIFGR